MAFHFAPLRLSEVYTDLYKYVWYQQDRWRHFVRNAAYNPLLEQQLSNEFDFWVLMEDALYATVYPVSVFEGVFKATPLAQDTLLSAVYQLTTYLWDGGQFNLPHPWDMKKEMDTMRLCVNREQFLIASFPVLTANRSQNYNVCLVIACRTQKFEQFVINVRCRPHQADIVESILAPICDELLREDQSGKV